MWTPVDRSSGQVPGTLPARPACSPSAAHPTPYVSVLRDGKPPQLAMSPQPAAALELEALRLSLSNMHVARLELAQAHLQREKDSALTELRDMLNGRHAQELALLHSRQQLQLEELARRYQQETGTCLLAAVGNTWGSRWPAEVPRRGVPTRSCGVRSRWRLLRALAPGPPGRWAPHVLILLCCPLAFCPFVQ